MQFRARFVFPLLLLVAAAPIRAADYSQPARTLQSLQQAAAEKNMNAIKDCYDIDDSARAYMQTLFDLNSAALRLRAMVAENADHMGSDAEKNLYSSDLSDNAERLAKALPTARLKPLDADHATLVLTLQDENSAAAPTVTTLYFHKVGDDWKIDAAATYGLDKPATAKERMAQRATMLAVTGVLTSVAADINAGRFATLHQVQQAINDRTLIAFQSLSTPATSSSSMTPAPTSAPAPAASAPTTAP